MKYLSKHKNKLIFLITILVIGIIFGIILGIKQPNNIRENIIYGISNIKEPLINTKANNIFTHLIILLALGVLSSFFIGLFLAVIYLFYNGVVIGFNIYCLTLVYNFKGLLFSISYNIIFKLLFLLTFVFLILKYSNLTKNMIFLICNINQIKFMDDFYDKNEKVYYYFINLTH